MRALIAVFILFLLAGPSLAELPQSWEMFSHSPRQFLASREETQSHQGVGCGRLLSQGTVSSKQWASLLQKIDAKAYRGRRLTLRGYLKGDSVKGWAGLWLRIDGPNEETLGFENSDKTPIRGTTDWTPYLIEMDVPLKAQEIHFGLLLAGGGDVRIDTLELTSSGPTKPAQPIISHLRARALPSEPSNLDFEK